MDAARAARAVLGVGASAWRANAASNRPGADAELLAEWAAPDEWAKTA